MPHLCWLLQYQTTNKCPDSKVHRAHMGPTWGRQDPGGPQVVHVNLAIWVYSITDINNTYQIRIQYTVLHNDNVIERLSKHLLSSFGFTVTWAIIEAMGLRHIRPWQLYFRYYPCVVWTLIDYNSPKWVITMASMAPNDYAIVTT